MPSDDIKISKFVFWLITTLLGSLVLGVGAWATNINSQMVAQQIAMAEMKALVLSVDTRLKENLNTITKIHELESELKAIKVQTNYNTNDLVSSRGTRFSMPDYDKYVKPVQDDLLKRVTTLEAKAN